MNVYRLDGSLVGSDPYPPRRRRQRPSWRWLAVVVLAAATVVALAGHVTATEHQPCRTDSTTACTTNPREHR